MEKVNQWLTLAANIGVLVGILFLIVELDQNTRAQNGATMQAFVAATAENNSILATNKDLIDIVVRGDSDGMSVLNATEQRRYLHLATQVFQGWEALYLQTLDGTIDPTFWLSKRPGLADAFTNKGVRDFWSRSADLWFDARFRAEIDAIAEESTRH